MNERRRLKDSGELTIDVHLRITPSGAQGGAGSDGVIGWDDVTNEIHVDILKYDGKRSNIYRRKTGLVGRTLYVAAVRLFQRYVCGRVTGR